MLSPLHTWCIRNSSMKMYFHPSLPLIFDDLFQIFSSTGGCSPCITSDSSKSTIGPRCSSSFIGLESLKIGMQFGWNSILNLQYIVIASNKVLPKEGNTHALWFFMQTIIRTPYVVLWSIRVIVLLLSAVVIVSWSMGQPGKKRVGRKERI